MSKQPVVFSPLANTYGGGIYGLNRNIASVWCVVASNLTWQRKYRGLTGHASLLRLKKSV